MRPRVLRGSLDNPLRRRSLDDPFRRNRSQLVMNDNQPCILSTLADLAEQPLSKWTLQDLLQMEDLTREERAWQVHETLKVGVSHCVMHLKTLPFGFCNMPSIQKVISDYVTDFRELIMYEQRPSPAFKIASRAEQQEHLELVKRIYDRHRSTMIDVCRGVFEFREDLTDIFGNGIDLAELRADIALLGDIESSLNEFFTKRFTIRLIAQHANALNDQVDKGHQQNTVGIVNTHTQPISILVKAHQAAKYICMRDFGAAPELLVNGVEYEEYLQHGAEKQWEIAHVRTILYYVFFEIVKNAARASLECSMDPEDKGSSSHRPIPPIRVTVPEQIISGDTMFGNPSVVKLADTGVGMSRPVLQKAGSYFFSSVKDRPAMSSEVSDFDRGSPLAGFGFGLPISRVLARYFSGDVDMNSIPGKGTEVYVYL